MFRRAEVPAALALLAVLAALLGPALLPAYGLAGGDWTDLYYPFRRFAAAELGAGRGIPLWNPSIFGGMPHLASLNAATLYPTDLATLPLPVEASAFYAGDLIGHLLLAALGMQWWLRRRGMTPGAAAFGALAYALGGHLLTLAAAGHGHWVRGMAWLPWMFAGAEAGTLAGAAAAGAALGAIALGAAMHFVLLAAPVVAVRMLLAEGAPGRRWLRVTAFACAAASVGAVVWIPGLEYYVSSIRPTADRAFTSGWSLSLWELPALVLPGCWGGPTDWFGPHVFRSSADYPGLVVVALALVGAVARPRHTWPWMALVAGAVVFALGRATPVGAVLAALPVYRGLRAPLRWLSFAHLALAVLAATGWSALLEDGDRQRARSIARRIAAGLAVWAGLVAAGALRPGAVADRVLRLPFVAEHISEHRVTEPAVRDAVGHALADGAVRAGLSASALGWLASTLSPAAAMTAVAMVALDLGTAARPWYQYADDRDQRRPDAVAQWLTDHVRPSERIATDEYFGLPNRRMGLGLEFTTGYHGLPLARTMAVNELAMRTGSLAILAALNARWIVTGVEPQQGWTPAVKLEDASGDPVWILPHPAPLSRAWAAWPTPAANATAALAAMGEPGWTPAVVPLEGPTPAGWRPHAGAGTAPHGRIALTGTTGEVNATVELDRDALVVFSETWYPAWRATLDGTRVPILIACGTLRALAVPQGTHVIGMRYAGCAVTIGMWLTSLGIVALAGLAVLP